MGLTMIAEIFLFDIELCAYSVNLSYLTWNTTFSEFYDKIKLSHTNTEAISKSYLFVFSLSKAIQHSTSLLNRNRRSRVQETANIIEHLRGFMQGWTRCRWFFNSKIRLFNGSGRWIVYSTCCEICVGVYFRVFIWERWFSFSSFYVTLGLVGVGIQII